MHVPVECDNVSKTDRRQQRPSVLHTKPRVVAEASSGAET